MCETARLSFHIYFSYMVKNASKDSDIVKQTYMQIYLSIKENANVKLVFRKRSS